MLSLREAARGTQNYRLKSCLHRRNKNIFKGYRHHPISRQIGAKARTPFPRRLNGIDPLRLEHDRLKSL